MESFITKYLEMSKDIPMMVQVRYIITGNPRYRIEVYGKEMVESHRTGQRSDALLIMSEGEEWQQVVNRAESLLIEREPKIREFFMAS